MGKFKFLYDKRILFDFLIIIVINPSLEEMKNIKARQIFNAYRNLPRIQSGKKWTKIMWHCIYKVFVIKYKLNISERDTVVNFDNASE